MTREQLIQAMSLMTFTLDVDYTMEDSYFSIVVSEGLDKPLEQDLQAVYDAWEYQTTLNSRIQALGDLSLLMSLYLSGKQITDQDSCNLAGFTAEKIDTPFGWNFQNVPKPNIDDLESLVAQRDSEVLSNAWADLRRERTRRLSLCDWTQLQDAPLSVQQKIDWTNYRQALRDLPENTEDPSNPSWPGQP